MAGPGRKHAPEGFMGRPRHRLFMVFDGEVAPDDAWAWLRDEEGVDPDVWVLRGEEGLRSLDASGRLEGLRGRIVRVVEHALSSDVTYLRLLQAALEAGATVVAVPVAGADAADRLARRAEAHGARDPAYFAEWEFWPVRAKAG